MCSSEHQRTLMLAKSNVACIWLGLLRPLIEYGVDLTILMLMAILMLMGTFQSISLNWETLERRCRFQWSTVSMMIPSWPLRQLDHSRSVCETWMLGWLTIPKLCAVFENYLEIFRRHCLPMHEGIQGATVVL